MDFYHETERLILRNILPTDLDGMFTLDSNPLVHKYLGNKPISSKTEAAKAIDYIMQQYKTNQIGRWAIIEKESNAFIGWSGLKLNTEQKINNRSNFYDVGYRFIPKYWGKGYATETANIAMDYGFNTMKLNLITGIAESKNIASNKVLQKIGLQFINTFRYDEQTECHWYELQANQFQQQ